MEDYPEEIHCANCSAPMTGRFCASCGQSRFAPQHLTLRHFFGDLLKEVFTVDNRLFRSLRPLLMHPGALTLEYLSGRQQKYIKPVSLFIFVNIFFFFAGYRAGLMNWNMSFAYGNKGKVMVEERAAALQVDPKEYLVQLNSVFQDYQRSFFFGVIPLFAVAMKLVCFRKRRSVVEFLIYSIHFHSSYLILLPVTGFISLIVLGIVDAIGGTGLANYFGNDPGIAYYAVGLMVLYHFLALRRIYGDGPVTAFIQAAALGAAGAVIMVPLGQISLFWLVWFTAA